MLMAWCGQNSLHLKQEQQRWLFNGNTSPLTFANTPIEHISMQTQLFPHRSGSIYTSNCTVDDQLTSMVWHTVPAGNTAALKETVSNTPEGGLTVAGQSRRERFPGETVISERTYKFRNGPRMPGITGSLPDFPSFQNLKLQNTFIPSLSS